MIKKFSKWKTAPPIHVQGVDVDTVQSCKCVGVHLDNKQGWKKNPEPTVFCSEALMIQHPHVRSTMLRMFYQSVLAGAIFIAVMCWNSQCQQNQQVQLALSWRTSSNVDTLWLSELNFSPHIYHQIGKVVIINGQ